MRSEFPMNITVWSPTMSPPLIEWIPISFPRGQTPFLPQTRSLPPISLLMISAAVMAVPLGASFFWLWCASIISTS